MTAVPMPLPFIIAWLAVGAGLFLAFEATLDPRVRRLGAVVLTRVLPIGRRLTAAEAFAAALLLAVGFVLMATGGVLLRGAIPW
jgi:hypothetical protein